MTIICKIYNRLSPLKTFLQPKIENIIVSARGSQIKSKLTWPRKRFPPWFIKQTRVQHREDLTKENREFIQQVIKDKYPAPDIGFGSFSPLKLPTIEPNTEWNPAYRRVGVIAKKLGVVPMYMKDGTKVSSTLFQVVDNHVIKYTPPEEYEAKITKKKNPFPAKTGCILVGAESKDPQLFTKEYCGLFAEAGVMPKRLIARFFVSPEAALQPGIPLFATHFKVGQYVDVRGKTIDRGFQGVMKRWGFHGMPATHGVTKTHRRPGNIGSGGKKARVMPGTKLPGHMGNRYRTLRGQRILRINTKYNVIWLLGQNTAGEVGALVTMFDTLLPLKSLKATQVTPYFPTYFPNIHEELPEELFVDDLHNYEDPTIMFKEE
ncbi:large ribosomal subunit protein uL3m [Phymastichus coffea]|uniref:large ribosomal subunit protein uL3m n=1 Tax=Phymastichus coffea TaxID=108790 RepID=UPI00273A9AC7|nr:large ribosomal subunit protein uL3m [Phymastichus coffea]